MTKHRKRKQRTYKRIQRGGIWPFTESDPNAPSLTTQASGWFQSKKPGAESSWGSLGSWFSSSPTTTTDTTTSSTYTPTSSTSSSSSSSSSYTSPSTSQIPTTPQTQSYTSGVTGGKRRRMRGGKGGLGLTYYATPVSGLKVVEPNEWLLYNNGANHKGGSRKRRCKSRNHKGGSRKRRCKSRKR